MDKIWNELLAFETRDLVERYVKCKFNRELNKERTLQITSNFVQGREYFRSSENSSPTVRPLLQYYGVMALSKGLILTLDLLKTEAQLKSSHGLEANNWKKVIKERKFENLEIVIRDGTFSELLNVTKNRNYLRANSSRINYGSHLKTPKNGDILTLKQLIQYFPDLHREYYSWINEKLNYAILKSLKADNINKILNIELTGNIEQSIIELMFPAEYCPNLEVKRENNSTKVQYSINQFGPNITQLWHGAFNIGDACVIPTLPNDIGLNLLSGLYMISYVFGMLARYFPTTWIGIMRGEKGDKIYPFAYRLMDFIEEKYPLLVLDFLNSPYDFEKD